MLEKHHAYSRAHFEDLPETVTAYGPMVDLVRSP